MNIQTIHGLSVFVDEQDYEWLSKFRWSDLTTRGLTYAFVSRGRPHVYMHRLIMRAEDNEYVDHINRNGLDNRRENLRIVSQGVNIANAKMFTNNTSGFKGVVRYRNGWKAQLKYNQRMIQSNEMADSFTAAVLRDAIVRLIFGSSVYLNFPDQTPSQEATQEAERLVRNYWKRVSQHNA